MTQPKYRSCARAFKGLNAAVAGTLQCKGDHVCRACNRPPKVRGFRPLHQTQSLSSFGEALQTGPLCPTRFIESNGAWLPPKAIGMAEYSSETYDNLLKVVATPQLPSSESGTPHYPSPLSDTLPPAS